MCACACMRSFVLCVGSFTYRTTESRDAGGSDVMHGRCEVECEGCSSGWKRDLRSGMRKRMPSACHHRYMLSFCSDSATAGAREKTATQILVTEHFVLWMCHNVEMLGRVSFGSSDAISDSESSLAS